MLNLFQHLVFSFPTLQNLRHRICAHTRFFCTSYAQTNIEPIPFVLSLSKDNMFPVIASRRRGNLIFRN